MRPRSAASADSGARICARALTLSPQHVIIGLTMSSPA